MYSDTVFCGVFFAPKEHLTTAWSVTLCTVQRCQDFIPDCGKMPFQGKENLELPHICTGFWERLDSIFKMSFLSLRVSHN